jgi:hypothetical protein
MKNIVSMVFVLTLVFPLCLQVAVAQEEGFEDLLEMDLEDILATVIEKGGSGSFGKRLLTLKHEISLSGYVVNEFFKQQEQTNTFDNHYFNVFVTAPLRDNVLAEIQLEYEHGGEEIQVRYAQLDWIISDALIIRTGRFLTPVGAFNEYLYPEYINKPISRPFALREIVPVAWGEVGLQVRGKYALNPTVGLNYAAFLVNGLQGEEGGGIRGMRNNFRDKKDGDKAVGGRLGVDLTQGLELGVSGYSGIYTEDGGHRLTIIDAEAAFSHNGLSLRGEFATAMQGTSKDDLTKWGFYAQASYKFLDRYEPVVRFDQIELDGKEEDKLWRVAIGMNYYVSESFVTKVNVEHIENGGDEDKDDDLVGVQFALGF